MLNIQSAKQDVTHILLLPMFSVCSKPTVSISKAGRVSNILMLGPHVGNPCKYMNFLFKHYNMLRFKTLSYF